jgi:ribosomal protein S18 acetylase RimI-like enzyme
MRVGPSMQEVIGPGLPLTRTSLEQINSGLAMPMTASPDIEIRPFAERDRKAVIALWHLCELTRPWNDPDTDIDLATACPSSTILVGEHEGAIIASAMVGFDGHRGWVYYLAVDPDSHGKGHGRRMMCAAEAWLALCGAPKVELLIRNDNRRALGYQPQQVSVMAKRLDGRE